MNAFKRLAGVLVGAAVAGGLACPALAADSVTVDASIDVAAPCITVSTNSLDFGEHELTADVSTAFADVTYTSCSVESEHIFGRGTDAAQQGEIGRAHV